MQADRSVMGSQWGYDKTYMRAKHEGYRSRAAYKLIEIQNKFAIIRTDDNVIDLGAAPGSWLQVLRTLTQARVLGIDLNPIAHLDGVETIEGDLTLGHGLEATLKLFAIDDNINITFIMLVRHMIHVC